MEARPTIMTRGDMPYGENFITRRTDTQVLFHDIEERGKIIVTFETVHAVIDGNKTHTFLAEYLHYLSDFEIVTPQPAHVLHNDTSNIPGLYLGHHGHEAGTVKAGATDTIIREMGRIRQVIPTSEFL